MGLRIQRHVPAAFYPRERPGIHCAGVWIGPRTRLDRCGKSRLTGIRSPDRPARSQSLYRLRYPTHIHPLPNHILTSDFSVLPTSPGAPSCSWSHFCPKCLLPTSCRSVTYILPFRRTVCITFALTLGILTFVQESKYGGKGWTGTVERSHTEPYWHCLWIRWRNVTAGAARRRT
jgi:hypothetical protein